MSLLPPTPGRKQPKKPPKSNPSSRVRSTAPNSTINAATMNQVEEAHLDAVLQGLNATQFNHYSLKTVSQQDKLAARLVYEQFDVRYSKADQGALLGCPSFASWSKDLIGWITGVWGEARPLGKNSCSADCAWRGVLYLICEPSQPRRESG